MFSLQHTCKYYVSWNSTISIMNYVWERQTPLKGRGTYMFSSGPDDPHSELTKNSDTQLTHF
jgi:hypothetical protein